METAIVIASGTSWTPSTGTLLQKACSMSPTNGGEVSFYEVQGTQNDFLNLEKDPRVIHVAPLGNLATSYHGQLAGETQAGRANA